MTENKSPLDDARVASPCTASWEDMRGDDRSRFCSQCRLNVYNLSAMTREEAETLVRAKEGGRLCVRFYRRADGTVLTQDCPVGLRAARLRLARLAGTLAAALAGLGAFGTFKAAAGRSCGAKAGENWAALPWRDVEPFATVINWIYPEPAAALLPFARGGAVMGDLVTASPGRRF